jgi:hypothetical protein
MCPPSARFQRRARRDARAADLVFELPPGELAVLPPRGDREIDVAVDGVGVALFDQAFDELDLFGDVLRRARIEIGVADAEPFEVFEVPARHLLGDLERVDLLDLREALDLVLAVFGVVDQVADVRDVLNVFDAEAEMPEVADDHVEGDVRLRVPQVRVGVDGRAADVHADLTFDARFEALLLTSQRVDDVERVVAEGHAAASSGRRLRRSSAGAGAPRRPRSRYESKSSSLRPTSTLWSEKSSFTSP